MKQTINPQLLGRLVSGSVALGMHSLFETVNEALASFDLDVRLPIWWEKPDREELGRELKASLLLREVEVVKEEMKGREGKEKEEEGEAEEVLRMASIKEKLRRLNEEMEKLEKEMRKEEEKKEEEEEEKKEEKTIRKPIPSPRERRLAMIKHQGYVNPYTLEPVDKTKEEKKEEERTWGEYFYSFWEKKA